MIRETEEQREAVKIAKAVLAMALKPRKAVLKAQRKAYRQGLRAREKALPRSEEQRQPRKRDNGFLAFLRRLPCLHCGAQPSDAAHVRMGFLEPGWRWVGKAEKPDDNRAVPFCRRSHELQHSKAEASFWAEDLKGLHAPTVCAALYGAYQAGEDGAPIIERFRREAGLDARPSYAEVSDA